jgi:hypothetical protein
MQGPRRRRGDTRARAKAGHCCVLLRPIPTCGVTTDAVGKIRVAPTISRFYGIVIAMFFDDHGYPHFHARHAGAEAKVRLDQIEVIESTLEVRHLRLVLAWAELHREELLENWRLARAGEKLKEIEPLR